MAAPEVTEVTETKVTEVTETEATTAAEVSGQVSLPAAVPGPAPVAGPAPMQAALQVPEQPPILITKAGAAADRADFSQIVDTATPPRRLEFVDKRSAVVLYVADSEVQPTRECVSTVAAISQATGRVAVGLIGNGEYAEAWRQEIDSTIPMGALDARMARTLVLLAEGPPRSSGENSRARRARNARAQLAQERSRGAGAAARLQRKMQLAAEEAVRDALRVVAEEPAGDQAELQSRAEDAAAQLRQRCSEELGFRVNTEVPAPERPARPSYVMEAVVAVASLGVAFGAVRILHGVLMWVGVPIVAAQLVALAVGLCVAVVAVGATIRRNARQRTAQWRANYLAHLRRRWAQSVETAVRESLGARGPGWRIEQLAEYTGASAR